MLSRQQNSWQNHDIMRDNRSFEDVVQLKCFGTTVPNQNLVQEEIELG
jgi:hypothetical protein